MNKRENSELSRFSEKLNQGNEGEKQEKREKILTIITLIKLFFMFSIAFFAVNENQWDFLQFITFITEILLIFFLSQLFYKNKFFILIGYILSSLIYILALSNMISVSITGGFVSYLMWTNISNIRALGSTGNLLYIAVIVLIILSFLPQRQSLLKKNGLSGNFMTVSICLGLIISGFSAGQFEKTSLSGWIDLYQATQAAKEKLKDYQVTSEEEEEIYQYFEREGIESGFEGDLKKPNVILIFTEGLSTEVIESNLYDNLTPNFNQFKNETLTFQNYYNHTAPTDRGIRGQLFSSQQYFGSTASNLDALTEMLTTNLISLPSILTLNGYSTTMINPEPDHEIFSTYLDELDFEQIITGEDDVFDSSSKKVLTDAQNFELLLDEALKENEKGKSFFLTTYTFGTHIGLNSDIKYGDGKNPSLNNYHAVDKAFGDFWNQFKDSPLYDNTLVVFTTDHPTYSDLNYNETFNVNRGDLFVSEIPLMIYYPGMSPKIYDAAGKNSLSLTPTILDILNYENSKNYFLGHSLFADEVSEQQYITAVAADIYSTKYYQEGVIEATANPEFVTVLEELAKFQKISLNY